MKHFYKATFALAICVVFFYAACKKSGLKPAPKVADEQEVAGVVALNIQRTLAGQYGGVNIGNGVQMPTQIASTQTRHVINSTPGSLCGLTVDTTVTYTFNQGDTIKSTVQGKWHFVYTCTTTIPDGYKVNTSLLNIGTAPQFSFIYDIQQNYTVQANADYSEVSLNGTLKSYGDFKDKPKAFVDSNFTKTPNFQHQDYVLTNLVITVANNFDIVSGTSTFVTSGNNGFGTWTYHGTITYTGNHMAIITINGKSYKANLITGLVTPE
jgi:hypothetical protein